MQLIEPKDAGYDEARKIWNGAIDRRPSAVALPENEGDVAQLVRDAQGRSVTIRCGGHSAPGHSVADGALVIDLSRLRSVEVDAGRAIARVGGGCLWSHV